MDARGIMGRSRRFALALSVVVLPVVVAACGSAPPSATPLAAATDVPSPTPFILAPSPPAEASPSASPLATAPPSRVPVGGPIGATGTVVVLGNDGSLVLVAANGSETVLAPNAGGGFAFPAWSPDGSRIAAIGSDGSTTNLSVYEVGEGATDAPASPTLLLQDADIAPFYLSWLPDSRTVSYLATESGDLALRIAPVDGSAPTDGSDPSAIVRIGNPFYFDWIDNDRVLAHIGTGTDAFLGEIGLDGSAVGPGLGPAGDFRSAVMSHDRSHVAFVRPTDASGTDEADAAEVVVAERDGSDDRALPVYGMAALAFDPAGDLLATIGAAGPGQATSELPIGPLRLLDPANGEERTLLDGQVASFWWSPDGTTIAALRVQPIDPAASAGGNEVRLLFVDVVTGDIRSQPVVAPGRLFVEQLLVYFDQYALSHRLWAPDSSSFLLPVTVEGRTRVAVLSPDGGDPVLIDGQAAFWSPPTD